MVRGQRMKLQRLGCRWQNGGELKGCHEVWILSGKLWKDLEVFKDITQAEHIWAVKHLFCWSVEGGITAFAPIACVDPVS